VWCSYKEGKEPIILSSVYLWIEILNPSQLIPHDREKLGKNLRAEKPGLASPPVSIFVFRSIGQIETGDGIIIGFHSHSPNIGNFP